MCVLKCVKTLLEGLGTFLSGGLPARAAAARATRSQPLPHTPIE
jgi:hypothetical protein